MVQNMTQACALSVSMHEDNTHRHGLFSLLMSDERRRYMHCCTTRFPFLSFLPDSSFGFREGIQLLFYCATWTFIIIIIIILRTLHLLDDGVHPPPPFSQVFGKSQNIFEHLFFFFFGRCVSLSHVTHFSLGNCLK